jgi:hypothetical protein
VTTVRIKKPPLWKVTATVKLTSGEILVASASVRAKTIMEAMDSDPLWESMADDALDNDRIKALLGLFQQSTRWYGYPPSDPGADAIKFLNIMAAEAEDSRTLISSSITAMAQAIQDTFGCPPEHRPGGDGGLAS